MPGRTSIDWDSWETGKDLGVSASLSQKSSYSTMYKPLRIMILSFLVQPMEKRPDLED